MKTVRALFPVLLLFVGACAWWMAGRPGLDADRIIFDHAKHKENGVECDTCHAGVKEATTTKAWHRPKEATCVDCHERDQCATCHTQVASRAPASAPALAAESGAAASAAGAAGAAACEATGAAAAAATDTGADKDTSLVFSHAGHLGRGAACSTCHPSAESATALPIELPAMSTCLDCHNHKQDYAEARCTSCHASLSRKPLTAVAEFSHAGDWMQRHGLQARSQGPECLQCHQQSTCSECHSRVTPAANAKLLPEQVERPLLHRGDFISTHAIEARANGATCQRCHQASSFCSDCHRASGVGVGAPAGRVPHPAGYAVRGAGTAFHGDDARVRIETCVACHDQGAQSNCVSCHKVGGIGGNPHPRGFSARHDRDDASEEAMCQTCHTRAP